MKNKPLISLFVIFLALVLIIFLSKNFGSMNIERKSTENNVKAVSENFLMAIEPFYDFGTISMFDGKVTHTFNIANRSEASIKVKKVYTSCMCTTATLVTTVGESGPFGMQGHAPIPIISRVIGLNENASVYIIFDPAAHGPGGVGKIRRTVYIETDVQKKPLELTFEANVIP